MKLMLSHITKAYGGRTVLTDCSYTFEKTGTYALMGPNGSGKSTFLRMCALLEEPDIGEVSFYSGQSVVEKNIALKRRMTLVLPRVGVFNATVFKNVAYGLKVRGMSHREMVERVEKTVDLVGLSHKKNQNALTLSSGEAQRLGIARALAIGPEFLFLDEPTASIDRENTGIIEDMILKLKTGGSTTVIITTHDPGQAERLGDRILMLSDCRLAEVTPADAG